MQSTKFIAPLVASTSALRRRTAATVAVTADSVFPNIQDIFDAPARMGEHPHTLARQRQRSHSQSHFQPKLYKPTPAQAEPSTSLPPPLLFDGPAKPRMRLLVTTRHVPSVKSRPEKVQYVQSEFITFDGPSRPHRSHHGPTNTKPPTLKAAILMGVVGTVTYSAFEGQSPKDLVSRTTRAVLGTPTKAQH